MKLPIRPIGRLHFQCRDGCDRFGARPSLAGPYPRHGSLYRAFGRNELFESKFIRFPGFNVGNGSVGINSPYRCLGNPVDFRPEAFKRIDPSGTFGMVEIEILPIQAGRIDFETVRKPAVKSAAAFAALIDDGGLDAIAACGYPRDMNQWGRNVDNDGTNTVRSNVGIMANRI